MFMKVYVVFCLCSVYYIYRVPYSIYYIYYTIYHTDHVWAQKDAGKGQPTWKLPT